MTDARACDLCCDDVSPSNGVECGGAVQRHFICYTCFAREVERVTSPDVPFAALAARDALVLCPFTTRPELHARRGVLGESSSLMEDIERACGDGGPTHTERELFKLFGCSSDPFSDRTVARCCGSDAIFEAYLRQRVRVREHRAFAEAQRLLNEQLQAAREAEARGIRLQDSNRLLARQLAVELPNARQCGGCGFGPIDHFKCDDLLVHHGQDADDATYGDGGDGLGTINNACPVCGWFRALVTEWPRWDGQLKAVPTDQPAPPAGAQPEPETEPAGTWTCAACTLRNRTAVHPDECEACGTSRPAGAPGATAPPLAHAWPRLLAGTYEVAGLGELTLEQSAGRLDGAFSRGRFGARADPTERVAGSARVHVRWRWEPEHTGLWGSHGMAEREADVDELERLWGWQARSTPRPRLDGLAVSHVLEGWWAMLGRHEAFYVQQEGAMLIAISLGGERLGSGRVLLRWTWPRQAQRLLEVADLPRLPAATAIDELPWARVRSAQSQERERRNMVELQRWWLQTLAPPGLMVFPPTARERVAAARRGRTLILDEQNAHALRLARLEAEERARALLRADNHRWIDEASIARDRLADQIEELRAAAADLARRRAEPPPALRASFSFAVGAAPAAAPAATAAPKKAAGRRSTAPRRASAPIGSAGPARAAPALSTPSDPARAGADVGSAGVSVPAAVPSARAREGGGGGASAPPPGLAFVFGSPPAAGCASRSGFESPRAEAGKGVQPWQPSAPPAAGAALAFSFLPGGSAAAAAGKQPLLPLASAGRPWQPSQPPSPAGLASVVGAAATKAQPDPSGVRPFVFGQAAAAAPTGCTFSSPPPAKPPTHTAQGQRAAAPLAMSATDKLEVRMARLSL